MDITTLLVGAVSTLAGVITYLWREGRERQRESEVRLTEKLQKCETEHSAARDREKETAERIGKLEGRFDLADEIKPSLTAISEAVLKLLEGQRND